MTPAGKAACHFREDAWTVQPVAGFFPHYFARFSSIGSCSDKSRALALHQFQKKSRPMRLCQLAGLVLLALFGGCDPPASAAAKPVSAPAAEARRCGDDGFLTAELFGSIEYQIDWDAHDFDCESMPRPAGAGLRLRFTGNAADREMSFILAVPDLERGVDGRELPTVVTLTVEGSGRFFSTASLDACFTDISTPAEVDENAEQYDVRGTLFCVTPLGEINGDAAISVPRMEFQSRVRWEAQ